MVVRPGSINIDNQAPDTVSGSRMIVLSVRKDATSPRIMANAGLRSRWFVHALGIENKRWVSRTLVE